MGSVTEIRNNLSFLVEDGVANATPSLDDRAIEFVKMSDSELDAILDVKAKKEKEEALLAAEYEKRNQRGN